MDMTYTFTKAQLIAAYTKWNNDAKKDASGNFADNTVPEPELSTETLLDYLSGRR